MSPSLHQFALAFVALTALGRVTGILVLKFRQARYSERAVAIPSSWKDRCTVPEPYVLGGMTFWFLLVHGFPAEASFPELVRVAAGFLLAIIAAVLMLWCLRAFPSVSTGHYVLPDQRVVSEGPYALVRHPLYLAAFIVWFSISLAFSSLAAFLITVGYVIPSYLVYMRSEEEMLLRHLGDAYAGYRERVGMLFPRLGHLRSSSRSKT
jgi:protein-S-isoprenylcysteine O-methyltransferase Ste14